MSDDVKKELLSDASVDEADGAVDLRALSLDILKQLSAAKPVRLETLKAEIERDLAYLYPDRKTVRHICQSLLGAMLADASLGPEGAAIYDRQWLNNAAGGAFAWPWESSPDFSLAL